ncbi:MAG: peptide-N-glycosidase F-related protein [Myxococcota bacterium]
MVAERLLPCLMLGTFLAAVTSCSDDALDAVDAGVEARDAVAMPDPDSGSNESLDTGVSDAGAPDISPPDVGLVDAGSPPMSVSGCSFAGYDPLPFDPSASTPAFGALTPDIDVQTLRGRFNLSEIWGDCSIVTLVPVQTGSALVDLATVVTESELNNIYLFFSWESDAQAAVTEASDIILGALNQQGEDFYQANIDRFHFSPEPPARNAVLRHTATIQTDYYLIDSRQRLRDAGSYRVFSSQGFVPQIAMSRFGAYWSNYERRLEERLAREEADPNVLVVPWLTEGHAETDEGRFPIQLPTAAEMQRFDRVEIVVKETCAPDARFPVHFGVCPAWDVGHKVTLCQDFGSCRSAEINQLFRHVTGYHTGGWWIEDVSHGLPFFKQGGTRWMRDDRRDFVGTIELRFYDDGELEPADTISDAKHLVGLGVAPWDPTHNDSFPNYRFTPPPGTVRVMLDARQQGGGNNQPSGCAEFCSMTLNANLNGTDFTYTFEMENDGLACARRAGEGVVAGQFGTWMFDRGSWCPGGPVERWRQDITSAVNLDGENTLFWTGSYNGNDWPPGGGSTTTAWLVFYGADGEATVEPIEPQPCENPPTVTLRDFSLDHPDFRPIQDAYGALEDGNVDKERARGVLTGVVADQLVEVDGAYKPRLIWPENTLPFTTAASFDDWWRDSDLSNTTTVRQGVFRRTRRGTFGYFASSGPEYGANPILDAGFGYGSEGLSMNVEGVSTPMNTAFTLEIVGRFEHRRGRVLRLGGTADVFVFADRRLVYESGGYLNKSFRDGRTLLDMDSLTELELGQTYDFHIFAVGSRGPRANPHIWLEHPTCD